MRTACGRELLMGKSIYTHYKERLVEIGGGSRCLYLKNITRRSSYDLGRIFEGRGDKVTELADFLLSDRKFPLTIIDQKEKPAILKNLDVESRIEKRRAAIFEGQDPQNEKLLNKIEKIRKDESARAIESEITRLKELQREADDIEKETGRRELFLGYPFVFGVLSQGSTKTVIKAPLLLFPIRIEAPDENTVEIRFNESERIHINPALVFAYAQAKRINVDQLELDFDDLKNFRSVADIIDYLADAHVKIDATDAKSVYAYSRFREPEDKGELSVRYAAVIGRFPLSNSIYNDYSLLEKKKLTNEAIEELLRMGKAKNKKPKKAKKLQKKSGTFTVKMLDYAQSRVVERVDERGNMVIYGPPGTGKSQTIVNIISDALSKNKSVLVVSQKKAALDVVYNRLGALTEKCMYINDESKEKRSFYERCFATHQRIMDTPAENMAELTEAFSKIVAEIKEQEALLDGIYTTLNDKRPFGLSLAEMYSSTQAIAKNSSEYAIYTKLVENRSIMDLTYRELTDALLEIKANQLEELYYSFIEDKEKNPLIDLMQQGLDIPTLSDVKTELTEIQKSRKGFFNLAKYPYYRQVMAYYKDIYDEDFLASLVKLECKVNYPDKKFTSKIRRIIRLKLLETARAIDDFTAEYSCLRKVLTEDGYIAVIDNILRGNHSYIKLVHEALDNYIAMRDITNLLDSLNTSKTDILNFAYTTSKNHQNYIEILEKLPSLRIYHEVVSYEEFAAEELARAADYQSIRAKITKLLEEKTELASKISAAKIGTEYDELYNTAKDNKDYLYQISKKQKLWPIRKTMELYSGYILSLFPCWLLSPENVSAILPLNKNMFDLVVFDEASQVFIENTIPTIFRGKNIVVAGDAKQLRPSATFMKRYLGGGTEEIEDVSLQAALEVDSLLDLAVARYDSANLTYHYRSRHSELIDFSNNAFYASGLQIAPNISKNRGCVPIERYKVDGKWIDRANEVEAKKVVELIANIFKTRKNNESIGIITFNSDQQNCIAEAIDKECTKNSEFRAQMLTERHRIENGEDSSIFVKNLENVQGDERDIIIFSIGYAENADGKVYTSFGSLSADGGENRLNVAITRAKNKIMLVTSIEPEELKVEGAKNLGPKLLKKYLEYVRAVSNGNAEEVKLILSALDPAEESEAPAPITDIASVEERIKERLVKLGYQVDTALGNKNNRISLAVYDEDEDKYLVGVELDKDAYITGSSTMERDIYKPKFLEERGWTILRVWVRDWWLYPNKVIAAITDAAEANRKSPKRQKKAKKEETAQSENE